MCLCTKEKTVREGHERKSEREQVLEWLMADTMNSQRCPFLIKGMDLPIVSAVNNENPAALRTPSIRCSSQTAKHLMNLLQTSFSLLPGNSEPMAVT